MNVIATRAGDYYIFPDDHKEMFFSMGVVDCAIYALKTSTLSHEQFKAIGILRLLVEKQGSYINVYQINIICGFVAHTCSYVILEAMECLNRVCEESGIPHVHIESGRLLSAVVKHCQDESKLDDNLGIFVILCLYLLRCFDKNI